MHALYILSADGLGDFSKKSVQLSPNCRRAIWGEHACNKDQTLEKQLELDLLLKSCTDNDREVTAIARQQREIGDLCKIL